MARPTKAQSRPATCSRPIGSREHDPCPDHRERGTERRHRRDLGGQALPHRDQEQRGGRDVEQAGNDRRPPVGARHARWPPAGADEEADHEDDRRDPPRERGPRARVAARRRVEHERHAEQRAGRERQQERARSTSGGIVPLARHESRRRHRDDDAGECEPGEVVARGQTPPDGDAGGDDRSDRCHDPHAPGREPGVEAPQRDDVARAGGGAVPEVDARDLAPERERVHDRAHDRDQLHQAEHGDRSHPSGREAAEEVARAEGRGHDQPEQERHEGRTLLVRCRCGRPRAARRARWDGRARAGGRRPSRPG